MKAYPVIFRLLSMYPSAPRSSSPPHRAKHQPIPRAASREEAKRDAISGSSRQYRGSQQSGQSEVPVQQGIGRRAQQEACRAENGAMGTHRQILRFAVQSVQIGAGRSGGQTGGDPLHHGLCHEKRQRPQQKRRQQQPSGRQQQQLRQDQGAAIAHAVRQVPGGQLPQGDDAGQQGLQQEELRFADPGLGPHQQGHRRKEYQPAAQTHAVIGVHFPEAIRCLSGAPSFPGGTPFFHKKHHGGDQCQPRGEQQKLLIHCISP